MNPQMLTFFESISDAAVLVNSEGQVQHSNKYGEQVFNLKLGHPFPDPRIIKVIKDLAAGSAKAPVKLTLRPDFSTQIMPLPPGTVYVILSQDVTERQFYQTTTDNFYEYLRVDLARPLQQFIQQVGMLDEDEIDASLLESGRTLLESLQRVALLAEVFGSAPLVAQERLPLEHMLNQSLQTEATQLEARKIKVLLDGFNADLPPVYGSQIWLARAFRELINNAARHAAPESTLVIAMRCTGTHVIITLRNHGHFAPTHARGKQVFVPFSQNTEQGRAQNLAQKLAQQNNKAQAKPPPAQKKGAAGAGIGLAICQQILHLHGGHLTIVEGEGEDVIEFNVELATGAPNRDSQALDAQQAQRYAHDMATLMQRMRNKASTQVATASNQKQN